MNLRDGQKGANFKWTKMEKLKYSVKNEVFVMRWNLNC